MSFYLKDFFPYIFRQETIVVNKDLRINFTLENVRDCLAIQQQNSILYQDEIYLNTNNIYPFEIFDGETIYPDNYFVELQMYQVTDAPNNIFP